MTTQALQEEDEEGSHGIDKIRDLLTQNALIDVGFHIESDLAIMSLSLKNGQTLLIRCENGMAIVPTAKYNSFGTAPSSSSVH